MIYVKKKLVKWFRINFDLWFSNVIKFHNFLILIKFILNYKLFFKTNKFYISSIIWFKIYMVYEKI